MRENELEKLRIEAAKIAAALNQQIQVLNNITEAQSQNTLQMESLYNQDTLEIQQVEAHRGYGIKLSIDIQNQERIVANTRAILERKQYEVQEAHKKVEILKKLKEKQEKQYYKDFLASEIKETDDITSARFKK